MAGSRKNMLNTMMSKDVTQWQMATQEQILTMLNLSWKVPASTEL
jgi:hypothetical protein